MTSETMNTLAEINRKIAMKDKHIAYMHREQPSDWQEMLAAIEEEKRELQAEYRRIAGPEFMEQLRMLLGD